MTTRVHAFITVTSVKPQYLADGWQSDFNPLHTSIQPDRLPVDKAGTPSLHASAALVDAALV